MKNNYFCTRKLLPEDPFENMTVQNVESKCKMKNPLVKGHHDVCCIASVGGVVCFFLMVFYGNLFPQENILENGLYIQ